ncbi:MAG: HEAT repeat domain-containing protein [Planctomycetota bacterium]
MFWEGSLEMALARARRLVRPVMIAIHSPEEKTCHRMLKKTYEQPEIRSLLREMVCVPACKGSFGAIESGPRRGKSVVFRTVTAEEHAAVEEEVRRRYLGGSETLVLPQHLFLDPDGNLVLRKAGLVKPKPFRTLLRRALRHVDPDWEGRKMPAPEGEDAGRVPLAGLFSADENERRASVMQLLGGGDKSRVLSLYRQLNETSTKILILEASWRGDMEWISPLVREALGEKDAELRSRAAVTAELSGNEDLVDDLIGVASREKDEDVLCELLRAIGGCGGSSKKARDYLVKALKSRKERVRANIYIALASLAPDKSTRELLFKRGLKDRTRARNGAIWALVELGDPRMERAIERIIPRGKRSRKQRDFLSLALRKLEEAVPERRWEIARRSIAGETVRR